jgi:acetylornithine deacetylase
VVEWLCERTGHGPASVPIYTEGPMFNRMGAQTVICGPGEIAQAHRVDEWVELDALLQATDLYRCAIEEFCT